MKITTEQSAIEIAEVRTKKSRRNHAVIEFKSETGIRYQVYPHSTASRSALKSCKVGESPRFVGVWHSEFGDWIPDIMPTCCVCKKETGWNAPFLPMKNGEVVPPNTPGRATLHACPKCWEANKDKWID